MFLTIRTSQKKNIHEFRNLWKLRFCPKNSTQFLDTDNSESKKKSHQQLPTTGILVCSIFFAVIGSPKQKISKSIGFEENLPR